ncbi:MAG: DUF4912 domain-containing protein [Sphaerochaetaceae bacterium]|nr:DUF4912 domain-containing protein [Sphaerochaetaceae bacterium]
MLLLNIGTLSDSELKYMAEQEGIEDWEDMDRDELIENLEELYGDSSDESSPLYGNYRFVKGLTDVPPGSISLPGVTPLPESYNDTDLYAVIKDSNWAYAMWSISHLKEEELREKSMNLRLRVSAGDHSYDIEVGYEDSSWNIELPWPGKTYTISLIATDKVVDSDGVEGEGTEEEICSAGNLCCPDFYFINHVSQLKNKNTFKLIFDPLFTNGGVLVKNNIVDRIFSQVIADRKKGEKK